MLYEKIGICVVSLFDKLLNSQVFKKLSNIKKVSNLDGDID